MIFVKKNPIKNRGYYKSEANLNIYAIVKSAYKSAEFILFILIGASLLLSTRINKNISSNISMFFVEITMPFSSLTLSAINLPFQISSEIGRIMSIKEENKRLTNENIKIKSLYIKSLNIEQENKYLKEILNFNNANFSKYITARLIGKSRNIYRNNLFINAGRNDGIEDGDVVIGRYGVIGRIYHVSKDKSRVLLISDIGSNIPVISSKTRERGILSGRNNSEIEILYLDESHKIKIGDMIFTSGDGDEFPYGILIGSVSKIDGGMVFVKAIEDAGRSDIVTILQIL